MLRLTEHYRGTGSVQHAESALNQLLDQEKYPKIQARAIYEKALIAFQRDDLTTALEHLDRIDVSEPGNAPMADIHYLRGDIARAMDDFANARVEYEAAAKDAVGTRLEQAALGSLITAYARKTGLDRKELARMMDKETWITAERAVELGFADAIIGDAEIEPLVASTGLTINPEAIEKIRAMMRAKEAEDTKTKKARAWVELEMLKGAEK